MVLCTILLNKTSDVQVKKIMRDFFKSFPDQDSIMVADDLKIEKAISNLGLQHTKAKRIKDFTAAVINDPRFYSKDVTSMPGIGRYAEESIDVFIGRNDQRIPGDKEIYKYIKNVVSADKLLSKVEGDIFCLGDFQPVARYAPKELLNYSYSYGSELFCKIADDERLSYIDQKLSDYKDQLEYVNYRLRWNRSNRQSIIQFDQPEILPNCTVSIQFQIRDDALYVTVFQRSQDIAKMEMDCEIFNRMALDVIKNQDEVDDYKVTVFVGNMHTFKFKRDEKTYISSHTVQLEPRVIV